MSNIGASKSLHISELDVGSLFIFSGKESETRKNRRAHLLALSTSLYEREFATSCRKPFGRGLRSPAVARLSFLRNPKNQTYCALQLNSSLY